jgi:asparagine synthase (glutamine-hydrolysing)
MSIIFGVRTAEGHSHEKHFLTNLALATHRFAVDGTFVQPNGRVGMGFQPYHTHERSNLEAQPVTDRHGNMLTFDGRLDNHAELRTLLDIQDREAPDSLIALAAFEHWEDACFSRFIGDWALALWSSADQSLYLARDHAGTRTLYYELVNGNLLWSTYLETFFAGGQSHDLDQAYAVRYLAGQPLHDLTPYKGIISVSPAHYLKVQGDNELTLTSHWNWLVKDRIRYQKDADYEEHFLSLFKESIERRSGPGAPILAQLSGGMDSSSIVCISDRIRRSGGASPDELIDTLSYFDNTEPSWNERPYFSLIEEQRGKTGIHIDTSEHCARFFLSDTCPHTYLLPGPDSASEEAEKYLYSRLGQGYYRVVLSGIGGDELLGGVPSPLPELCDYLAGARYVRLLRSTFEWALVNRTSLLHVLSHTARETVNVYCRSMGKVPNIPQWIQPRYRIACEHVRIRHATRKSRIGLLPSSVSNALSWWSIMETLPHLVPHAIARLEFRYPFLDRDLVDFLLCVPRRQLVIPGKRRRLMRAALKGIVPPAILDRPRKAHIGRKPLASLRSNRLEIEELIRHSMMVAAGLIDRSIFEDSLRQVIESPNAAEWPNVMRAIKFEWWLQSNRAATNLASLEFDPWETAQSNVC